MASRLLALLALALLAGCVAPGGDAPRSPLRVEPGEDLATPEGARHVPSFRVLPSGDVAVEVVVVPGARLAIISFARLVNDGPDHLRVTLEGDASRADYAHAALRMGERRIDLLGDEGASFDLPGFGSIPIGLEVAPAGDAAPAAPIAFVLSASTA